MRGIVVEWQFLGNWPTFLAVGFFLYWLTVLVVLVNDQRDPTKTLAWLIVLSMVPLVGLIIYYFFGRNWRKMAELSGLHELRRALAEPSLDSIRMRYAEDSNAGRKWAEKHGYAGLVQLIEQAEGVQPLPAYDVWILPGGAEKFALLKQELAAATQTINIQYFIWECDQLTAELVEILLERIAAGVEVRMLNDFIGCLPYSKSELRKLVAAGARVHSDVKQINRANYRNHRKIVVIDGLWGYTGGINVGQEYVDGGSRFSAWRDTHVRFGGPAVAELQKLFALRWYQATRETLFSPRFFPEEHPLGASKVPALTVATSVEDKWQSARRAHILAISMARKRIWIQTPYFVPDDQVYETMVNAALSGVDVRLMMTGIPDKRTAWYAAHTYLGLLLESGARVFFYTRGFFHAKTMTVDGKLLAIGTMNIDIRSLELHKELMVWFLDEDLAGQHEALFEADLAHCEEYTLERLQSLSRYEVFRNSAMRLASNLL
ncbi:cardiolipin synthase [Desulfonatronum parangueonense]